MEFRPFSLASEWQRLGHRVCIVAGAPSHLERIEMTSASARATFKVNQEPAAIVLDPNVRLLAATELSRGAARLRASSSR